MERFLTSLLTELLQLVPTHTVLSAMVRNGCVSDLEQRIKSIPSHLSIQVLIQHLLVDNDRLRQCLFAFNKAVQSAYSLKRDVILVLEKTKSRVYIYRPLTNHERGLAMVAVWPFSVEDCFAQLSSTAASLKARYKELTLPEREGIDLFNTLSRIGVAQSNWDSCNELHRDSYRGAYRQTLADIRIALAKISDEIWIRERTQQFEATKELAASNGWPQLAR